MNCASTSLFTNSEDNILQLTLFILLMSLSFSKQLSNSSREDFSLAQKLAWSIGLADHPPFLTQKSFFIQNFPHHPQHYRSKMADFAPAQRTLSARKVREKHNHLLEHSQRVYTSRKGSIKSVIISPTRPENDAAFLTRSHRQIIVNELNRKKKLAKDKQLLFKMERDKRQRSSLLFSMARSMNISNYNPELIIKSSSRSTKNADQQRSTAPSRGRATATPDCRVFDNMNRCFRVS